MLLFVGAGLSVLVGSGVKELLGTVIFGVFVGSFRITPGSFCLTEKIKEVQKSKKTAAMLA